VVETTSWLDYALIGIILLSSIISLIRGFVREAFSLATWIAAFWVAINFNEELADHLKNTLSQAEVRVAASFGILFVVTLLMGGIINFMLGNLLQRAGLSGTDRMLGVLFGVGRGIMLGALLLLLGSLTPFPNQPWWQQSQMLPYFQPLEKWMAQFIPQSQVKTDSEIELSTHASQQKSSQIDS